MSEQPPIPPSYPGITPLPPASPSAPTTPSARPWHQTTTARMIGATLALIVVSACCVGFVAANGFGGGATSDTPQAQATDTPYQQPPLVVVTDNPSTDNTVAVDTPVPPTPTPDTRAAAYAAVVLADLSPLENDFTQVGTDCGNADFATCRADLVQQKADAQHFLDDLNQTPTPPCLQSADAQLREALTNYINGSDIAIQGIDNLNADDIRTGTQMMSTGTTEVRSATTAVNLASC